jgi:hypothetical protein
MWSRSLNSSDACLSVSAETAALKERGGATTAAASREPAAIKCRLNALADVDDRAAQWRSPPALEHRPAGQEPARRAICARVIRNGRCRHKRPRIAAIRSCMRRAGMSLQAQEICTTPPDRIKRGPKLIQDIDFHDLTH